MGSSGRVLHAGAFRMLLRAGALVQSHMCFCSAAAMVLAFAARASGPAGGRTCAGWGSGCQTAAVVLVARAVEGAGAGRAELGGGHRLAICTLGGAVAPVACCDRVDALARADRALGGRLAAAALLTQGRIAVVSHENAWRVRASTIRRPSVWTCDHALVECEP